MNNHSGEWKDIKRGLILCIGILKSIFFERILPAENSNETASPKTLRERLIS
jgi:hypothetical protein